MNLNLREQLLITNALYMMEGEDLHPNELNEVQALMDKIGAAPIGICMGNLPQHLHRAVVDNRYDIWGYGAREYTVGESEDDSVIGSWIGYAFVQEIDVWLITQEINYAVFTGYE